MYRHTITCIYIYIYIYTYICMYIYVYVYACLCICVKGEERSGAEEETRRLRGASSVWTECVLRTCWSAPVSSKLDFSSVIFVVLPWHMCMCVHAYMRVRCPELMLLSKIQKKNGGKKLGAQISKKKGGESWWSSWGRIRRCCSTCTLTSPYAYLLAFLSPTLCRFFFFHFYM